MPLFCFFICVLQDSTPRYLSVTWLISWLVGQLVDWSHFPFFMFFILRPYCSCPNAMQTSNLAPAHPHTTGIAVYPALLSGRLIGMVGLVGLISRSPNIFSLYLFVNCDYPQNIIGKAQIVPEIQAFL